MIQIVLFLATFAATSSEQCTEPRCLCPPGEYVIHQCNATHERVCECCPYGQYTDKQNCSPDCTHCYSHCSKLHMEVVWNCTREHDIVCECIDGYWEKNPTHDSAGCIPHTTCKEGEGVLRRGTKISDTVCQRCVSGSHTDESGTKICNPVSVNESGWIIACSVAVALLLLVLVFGVVRHIRRRCKQKQRAVPENGEDARDATCTEIGEEPSPPTCTEIAEEPSPPRNPVQAQDSRLESAV